MSSEHRPLRVTPTNAGPDSKGIVSVFGWDLEGMVAFYLVAGALAGMLLVLCLRGSATATRVAAGAVPLLLSVAWVKFFVHGRPPSYQADVCERLIHGAAFRLRPQRWCRKSPPRDVLRNRIAAQEAHHG
jgi:hypothetical protein